MAPPRVTRHKCLSSSCNELVKENRQKYHSRSCARLDYFESLRKEGKLLEFLRPAEKAKRTLFAKRLKDEFYKICIELELVPNEQLKKLYITGRNRGYHNGWTRAFKRIRREA